MVSLQEILVFIIFLIAAGYLVTKFIWKPAFLGGKKKSGSCGVSDCGCDH
ncbi:hypothetical protein C7S20_06380 [Christiangramia fulva]|uniref:FeoB-associated Cys-rich membrane protein n=1 Tax=Christiangramia fulva TaxID=2126553 RepID=A0A2R3Z3T5_9FLAO|nr:FeoB-associated Cys-rich membrane protein [Christiangramia fulva]AVR44925.1 hypothetical protein C7S20_06380 [Christiangramia fulva]